MDDLLTASSWDVRKILLDMISILCLLALIVELESARERVENDEATRNRVLYRISFSIL
jgi:hypothetical protein